MALRDAASSCGRWRCATSLPRMLGVRPPPVASISLARPRAALHNAIPLILRLHQKHAPCPPSSPLQSWLASTARAARGRTGSGVSAPTCRPLQATTKGVLSCPCSQRLPRHGAAPAHAGCARSAPGCRGREASHPPVVFQRTLAGSNSMGRFMQHRRAAGGHCSARCRTAIKN